MVTKLGEGEFGKKYVPGHFGKINDLAVASNGKFVVSAGQDGMKTWIQSDDLMNVDIEN